MKKINWWAVLFFAAIFATIYVVSCFVGWSLNPFKSELQRVTVAVLLITTYQNLTKK
jgi:uncharacterized membrane protein YhaH (DUF805 family)